jgi:hypothetical protein
MLTSLFIGLDKITLSLDSFKMVGLHGIFHATHDQLSHMSSLKFFIITNNFCHSIQ